MSDLPDKLHVQEKILIRKVIKAGWALQEMREKRLYEEDGHKSFAIYCRKRWDMTEAQANKLIEAAREVMHAAALLRGETQ